MKKPSISFLKAFPVAYTILLALIVCVTTAFIYRNIYLTIAQVETVAELERTVARERLNRPLWDKIFSSRLAKLANEETRKSPHATTTSPFIRDPFLPF